MSINFKLSRMSNLVFMSSGGYLVGGSGFTYGVAPRVVVHRPVRRVVVRRPAVRQVDCCCFCLQRGIVDTSHWGRNCPYVNH